MREKGSVLNENGPHGLSFNCMSVSIDGAKINDLSGTVKYLARFPAAL